MKKIGLVLEGGAYRGIFTAGVLDYLLEQKIFFSYVIGVSAGAGNAISFVSKQNGKVKRVIIGEDDGLYFGIKQMIRSKKLLDTNQIINQYFYQQMPFDFDTFFTSSTECELVVTDCESGQPKYYNAKDSEQQLLMLTKATCSIPFLCKPVAIGTQHYLDGSLSDSVPVKYALQNKCDKVIVVLTRKWKEASPTDYAKLRPILNISYHAQYPNLVDVMVKRKETYEKQMEDLTDYVQRGDALVIQPENRSISHFEKDKKKVNAYYDHGKEVMEKRFGELCAFMKAS
ncbi:MAG: patatin family protein [Ruminococcus sp.]|nr:patatin family protein [Ruminococcus sp.]